MILLKITSPDNEHLQPASQFQKIDYPKPDGKLTFDLMTNLSRSGTNHEEDQPAHLKVKDRKLLGILVEVLLKVKIK